MRPPQPLRCSGMHHFDMALGVIAKKFATTTVPPSMSTIDRAGSMVYFISNTVDLFSMLLALV
jgi:hypothetical protein